LSCEGFRPGSLGARVKLANGAVSVEDSAQSEPGNQVGGFAMVKVDSKGEAIAWAEKFIKIAGDGVTEILQVFDMEECACAAASAEARETAGIV